jgi:hypothetical protein
MGSGTGDPRAEWLESWKEIATYLGVDIRTAQRYEQRDELPVVRDVRGTRGAVRARKEEIDRWLQSRRLAPVSVKAPEQSNVRRWNKRWALKVVSGLAAIAVLGVLAIAVLGLPRSVPPPSNPAIIKAGRLFARHGASVSIALDDAPWPLAFHPDGKRIFVTSHLGEKLWVISASPWRITKTIPLKGSPGTPFFSDDGSIAAIPTTRGVAIVDTRTSRMKHVALPGPMAVGVAFAGDRLYVAQGRHGMTRVHVPSGQAEPVPGLICPYYPVVDADRGRLYVACRCGGPGGRPGHDTVDILDLKTERIIGSTPSGPPLVGDVIVPTPAFDHLWLNGADACYAPFYDHVGCPVVPGSVVHLYRTSDGAFVKSFGWRHLIHTIAPHPDGKRVLLATESNGGSIQVLSTVGFHLLEELPVPGLTTTALSPDGRFVAATFLQLRKLVVFRSGEAQCEPAEDGLRSFWSADGTFDDAVRYHLRANGAVSFLPGLLGSAFRFGPAPGSLAWITAIGPKKPEEKGTLAVWVKPEAADRPMTVIGFEDADLPSRWSLNIGADGRFRIDTAQKVSLISQTAAGPDGWTHVAVVKTKERLELLVNGRTEASAAHTSGILFSGFMIGADRGGKQFFRGLIDEILLYERALTEPEVHAINELPRREPCTVMTQ